GCRSCRGCEPARNRCPWRGPLCRFQPRPRATLLTMRRWAVVGVGFIAWLVAGIAAAELPPGGTYWDDDGNVHEGAIEAIAAAGITRGCGESDMYCPDRVVTRGQMAAFLVRALGIPRSDRNHF